MRLLRDFFFFNCISVTNLNKVISFVPGQVEVTLKHISISVLCSTWISFEPCACLRTVFWCVHNVWSNRKVFALNQQSRIFIMWNCGCMFCTIKNGVGTCGLLQGTFKNIFLSLCRVALRICLMPSCWCYLLKKVLDSTVS